MDAELENLVQKMIKTKSNTLKITDSKLVKAHYDDIVDIVDIVEKRSIKTLVDSLNENGFLITYPSMQLSLKRQEKKKIITSNNQKRVMINHDINHNKKEDKIIEDKTKDTNISEDAPIKKHLSMQEKAALRIAELGINTETRNPFKKTTKG